MEMPLPYMVAQVMLCMTLFPAVYNHAGNLSYSVLNEILYLASKTLFFDRFW